MAKDFTEQERKDYPFAEWIMIPMKIEAQLSQWLYNNDNKFFVYLIPFFIPVIVAIIIGTIVECRKLHSETELIEDPVTFVTNRIGYSYLWKNIPSASEPTASTNLAQVEDGYMFNGINDYLEIHTDIYLEGYYTLADLENMVKRWKKYEK